MGPSWDQNTPFYGPIREVEQRKGNRIIRIYGAGDGNRTHVLTLGSLNIPIPFSSERLRQCTFRSRKSSRLRAVTPTCRTMQRKRYGWPPQEFSSAGHVGQLTTTSRKLSDCSITS